MGSKVLTKPNSPRGAVPAAIVAASLEGAKCQGVDLAPLLARVGIDGSALRDDARPIPAATFGRLLVLVSRFMNDEASGFLDRPMRVGTFAMFCHATITATDLRQALRRACQFMNVMRDDMRYCLTEQGEEAVLRLEFPQGEPPARYFIESLIIILVRWASWMIDAKILPSRVSLTAPPPTYAEEYNAMFPGQHYFSQAANYVAFPNRYLAMKVRQDPPSLVEFLKNAPGNLLHQYRNDVSLSGQVRRLIQARRPPDMTLDAVAQRLATSAPTLRRRLTEEGATFQQIKDQVRRDQAIYLLLHDNVPVHEIAEQVGYSEPSTFHRAFKKWTGISPGEYRESQAAAPRDALR